MEADFDIQGDVDGEFDELPGNGRTRERLGPGMAWTRDWLGPGNGLDPGLARAGIVLDTGHLISRDDAPPGNASTRVKAELEPRRPAGPSQSRQGREGSALSVSKRCTVQHETIPGVAARCSSPNWGLQLPVLHGAAGAASAGRCTVQEPAARVPWPPVLHGAARAAPGPAARCSSPCRRALRLPVLHGAAWALCLTKADQPSRYSTTG